MIGIGLFGVSAGVLQSCDDDDEIQNKPTLYIVTEDIEALSTYGGTIPVEFLCNLDWQVSTDATWITLDTNSIRPLIIFSNLCIYGSTLTARLSVQSDPSGIC